jgi:hypothetical protein
MDVTEVEPRFKVKRIRSAKHLAWIRSLDCSIPGCRRQPVDPHHLKCGPEGGGTVVASDCWAVPLCRWVHHDAISPSAVHATGDEAGWWRSRGIDPIALARSLAARSQALGQLKTEKSGT